MDIVKNETLLIIDGSILLFQMFFGMPSRIVNKAGIAIHGTLGFVGALLKIIRMTSPTHVVVLFDGEHENPRAEINPDYKAGRTGYTGAPDEDNPFSQLPDIYNALDYLKIKYYETKIYEADDVIASYALRYGNDTRIIISSQDSDMFQLINENVSVLRYRGVKTVMCDSEFIRTKLGVEPSRYADFKSLTGDASDNIKGAYKIGPVTAAALIKRFGSLEGVIIHAGEISKPSVRESIISSSQRLMQNYEIISLRDKAEIPFDISALKYEHTVIGTNEVLKAIGVR
jgi:5''-3'' exonuclease (including N-terminal domain of PolI)